jgi:hypothetical protein
VLCPPSMRVRVMSHELTPAGIHHIVVEEVNK